LSVADLPKNLIALDLDDHLVSRVMDACEELGISFTSYTEVQTYVLARTLVEFGAGAAVIDPFTAATANHDKVQCRPLLPNVPVDYIYSQKIDAIVALGTCICRMRTDSGCRIYRQNQQGIVQRSCFASAVMICSCHKLRLEYSPVFLSGSAPVPPIR
jgi:hypothetical protein